MGTNLVDMRDGALADLDLHVIICSLVSIQWLRENWGSSFSIWGKRVAKTHCRSSSWMSLDLLAGLISSMGKSIHTHAW